ncbi:hypothetical protein [Oerskovia enterophila]|uniref:hypothetical protein n=1 Tax=Oerskovia enterophila TaxID=43678 RepID=UPI0011122CB4|nr:hypothetical protein [Oerskovia enterophila]
MKPAIRVLTGFSVLVCATGCGNAASLVVQTSGDPGPPWKIGVEDGGRGWYPCVDDSGLATQSFTERLDHPSSGAGVIFDAKVTQEQAQAVLECVLGATDGDVTTNIPEPV